MFTGGGNKKEIVTLINSSYNECWKENVLVKGYSFVSKWRQSWYKWSIPRQKVEKLNHSGTVIFLSGSFYEFIIVNQCVITIFLFIYLRWSKDYLSSVQLPSRVHLFVTPWTAACQASLSISNSQSYSTSCPLSQWCHPTISSSNVHSSYCLQSFPASGSFHISQLFASGGQSIGSFSFSISPSIEYSGLISLRMDWLDLLAVQGTLKSLLQHHSSKASILQCSVFFIVQLSHPYMTTGKTIALTRWTFVGKVMSLVLICCLGWS